MHGFMIFPDQITTYIADKNIPWEYVWIEYDGLRAKSIVDAAGSSPDNPVYKARSKELRENFQGSCWKVPAGFPAALPYGKGSRAFKAYKAFSGKYKQCGGVQQSAPFFTCV